MFKNRLRILLTGIGIAALLVATFAGAAQRPAYEVRNLVSDGTVPGDSTDVNLRNAWGLAAGPTGPWSVAGNASAMVAFYDADGLTQQPQVHVPGSPTGITHNGGGSFIITDGASSAPARLLVASKDGTISGWSPAVPAPGSSTQAFVAVNNSAMDSVYTGIALTSTIAGDRLYAADFHNAKVDVFDGNFAPVSIPGAFVDPKLPQGYAPFGIQALLGRIFVTYAKQATDGTEPFLGQSLGIVNVFTTEGSLLARVATRGRLNAPWGLTVSPVNFGELGGDLLISNFGSGEILAYHMSGDLLSYSFSGVVRDVSGKSITVPGLRGIGFGNGSVAGPLDTLFFAAGPDNQLAGLFGRIDVATTP